MIHGYHVILPMYGFWLPNDPRGSWSDVVWKWELLAYGRATKSLERRDLADLTPDEMLQREQAQNSLKYPAVTLNGDQALSIGRGFGETIAKNGYSMWACSILPQHTLLVLARHFYRVEQMTNLLKGRATRCIVEDQRHPLQEFADRGSVPRMWAEGRWKVYLDSEQQIETAIRYVEENPERDGKKRQKWSFVEPFRGLPNGRIFYH